MYSNVLWRSIASIVKTFLRKRRPVLAIVYMINQGWEVGRYRSAVTPFAGYAILWVSLYWHRAWLEFAWVIVGKRKRGRCRRWCRTWAFLLCHLRLPSRHLLVQRAICLLPRVLLSIWQQLFGKITWWSKPFLSNLFVGRLFPYIPLGTIRIDLAKWRVSDLTFLHVSSSLLFESSWAVDNAVFNVQFLFNKILTITISATENWESPETFY